MYVIVTPDDLTVKAVFSGVPYRTPPHCGGAQGSKGPQSLTAAKHLPFVKSNFGAENLTLQGANVLRYAAGCLHYMYTEWSWSRTYPELEPSGADDRVEVNVKSVVAQIISFRAVWMLKRRGRQFRCRP
ncbi:hypothetical protein TNCV_4136421 [Trichonephila clavipes]|nr:hypothetical protein TNCV_4136421 [Trichonephila clavipes]